jgi:peroxiredoxin
MQSKTFLESDFLSADPIAVFGINHVVSAPTIEHLKDVARLYNKFIDQGCAEVWCVSFGTFELFDFLMPKFSTQVKFLQTDNIEFFRRLFNKRGHPEFLRNYWQFASVVGNGQIIHYLEQPLNGKLPVDTVSDIYSSVKPDMLLSKLNKY